MKRTLYIQKKDDESLAALFEGDTLIECRVQTMELTSLLGNIYRGKVRRVVPEMNAAFVDIGLNKPALLDARDIVDRPKEGQQAQAITELVKEGAVIWVQVIKDAVINKDGIPDKGVRVSSKLKIESPYFIYFMKGQHIGASKKVSDDVLKDRRISELRNAMEQNNHKGGVIIRTAAFDLSDEQYLLEFDRVVKKVDTFVKLKKEASKIGLIFQPMSFTEKTIADFSGAELDVVLDEQDNASVASSLKEKNFYSQVGSALKSTLILESGASIVIEPTEALVSIDVNTGSALEKGLSVLDVNIEALNVIAKQIRLRALSGVVFIDFINMVKSSEKKTLKNAVSKVFVENDELVTVHGMTKLGLMELSVKRTLMSLNVMSQFSTLLFASKQ